MEEISAKGIETYLPTNFRALRIVIQFEVGQKICQHGKIHGRIEESANHF